MARYHAEGPEPDRVKSYEAATTRRPAPVAKEALDQLSGPFEAFQHRRAATQDLDVDRLLSLAAIAFGKLRSRRVPGNGSVPDLLRKASPSGGSRRPTEGYVFARSVRGLDGGAYHFAVGTNSLDRIADLPPAGELRACLNGPSHAPFRPDAFMVLTSLFARNLYRYREPRTFRTIFMDVGHVLATLEIAAHGLGLRCFVQHGVDDDRLGRLLGLERLEEGVIFGAAIAGSDPS